MKRLCRTKPIDNLTVISFERNYHLVNHLRVADDDVIFTKTWILNIHNYFQRRNFRVYRPLKWTCNHNLEEPRRIIFCFISFVPRLVHSNPSETIWNTRTLKPDNMILENVKAGVLEDINHSHLISYLWTYNSSSLCCITFFTCNEE